MSQAGLSSFYNSDTANAILVDERAHADGGRHGFGHRTPQREAVLRPAGLVPVQQRLALRTAAFGSAQEDG